MFIDYISDYLISNYSNCMQDVCVVVPNLRSKIHLNNSIINKIGKSSIMPQILSSVEFITELVSVIKPISIIDNTTLLLHFFDVFSKNNTDSDFDNFISWASTALKDFNELDMYMADIESTFTYISEEKAIDLWSPEKKDLTDIERNYIHFFRSLHKYHDQLRQSLLDNNIAYSGLAYRYAAENIKVIVESINWDKVVFAGFNALSKSEIEIMDCLYENDKADMLWDADKYYVENDIQEAGYFLRHNFRRWTKTVTVFDEMSKKKEINIISSPGNIQQAMIAGSILRDNKLDKDKTALVLADENLLLYTLNCVPDEYNDVNITMDAPVNANSITDLYLSAINLHAKAGVKDGIEYDQKDLKDVVNNQVFRSLVKKMELNVNDYDALSGTYKIHADDLIEKCASNDLLNHLFMSWDNSTAQCLSFLYELSDKLRDVYNDSSYVIEYEIVESISKVLDNIKDRLCAFDYLKKFDIFAKLSSDFFRELSVSFYGETMKGLQIQGILETRLLDYENIIMMSVNDDNIPKSEKFSSFLTYTSHRWCKLPTVYEKNAIYAYHFYRLLQRAKKIFLIYDSSSSDIGAREPSRYIKQIISEMSRYSSDISINNVIFGDKTICGNKSKIEVIKDDFVVKLIDDFFNDNNLSPSALNNYLICPLKFFYSSILHISDNTLDNTIDSKMLGTITHGALQDLYEPYKERLLDDYFDVIETKIEDTIENLLIKKQIDYKRGKNLLLHEIIMKYVCNQIKNDREKKKLTILETEKKYSIAVDVTLKDRSDKSVKLKGIIDRIEDVGGEVRIMDYKTGSVDEFQLIMPDDYTEWNMKPTQNSYPKIVQLLFYAMLFLRTRGNVYSSVKSGLYAIRYSDNNLFEKMLVDGSKEDKDAAKITEKDVDAFIENIIKPAVRDIYDTDKPFTQCEDDTACKYCLFANKCFR